MKTYQVIRMYQGDHPSEVIETGLTLAEAQRHCGGKETSSKTATHKWATDHTAKYGPWFDGYEEE